MSGEVRPTDHAAKYAERTRVDHAHLRLLAELLGDALLRPIAVFANTVTEGSAILACRVTDMPQEGLGVTCFGGKALMVSLSNHEGNQAKPGWGPRTSPFHGLRVRSY
jgi:hypothetical protein